jgi:PAS domain S-box-containing protein
MIPADNNRRITRLVVSALHVPVALISFFEEDQLRVDCACGLAATDVQAATMLCRQVARSRRAVCLTDAGPGAWLTSTLRLKSYLGVPVVSGAGEVLGVLCAIDVDSHAFTAADVQVMHEFASFVADAHGGGHAREETFEHAAVGIIHASLDGRMLRSNPRIREMLGYAEGEMQTCTLSDLAHPDDVAACIELLARMRGGDLERAQREMRFRCRQQGHLWVSLSLALKRDASGVPKRLIAVIEDVSARKQVESELIRTRDRLAAEVSAQTRDLNDRNAALELQITQARESERQLRSAERRLRSIADSVPATIGYWDRDLRCEFANEAHRLWFGSAGRDLLGMTMPEIQGPQLFKLNEPYVRRALAGEAQHFERDLPKADGTASTVDVEYRPDIDENGEVRGFCVLVTDITSIRKARDEAIRLANAKTDFLANMSHEIRTPLNGMLGTTQLLLDTPLSEEQRSLAATSLSCGEHLLAIVNDVLDFSKIESGRFVLEDIAFDLESAVQQTCGAIAPVAQAKGLELHIDIALERKLRSGDPTRLRQVLLNLLSNAIKFTASGRVSVRVSDGDTTDGVLFSVADTGIGMSAEELPRVFERFTQADSSTSRRFGGSGLGLSICRRLVGLMGGQLSADSKKGVGSRFWFEIPLAVAAASDTVTFQAARVDARSLDGLRVLVAEDNAVNQMLVNRMLQRLGCAVTVVPNGAAAVEAWSAAAFDVVLMDCQMPEMDGFEATRRIRSMPPAGATVPIIALTAGALHTDRAQATLAGMSDFLTKPLFAKTLEDALRRALEQANGRELPAPANRADDRPGLAAACS